MPTQREILFQQIMRSSPEKKQKTIQLINQMIEPRHPVVIDNLHQVLMDERVIFTKNLERLRSFLKEQTTTKSHKTRPIQQRPSLKSVIQGRPPRLPAHVASFLERSQMGRMSQTSTKAHRTFFKHTAPTLGQVPMQKITNPREFIQKLPVFKSLRAVNISFKGLVDENIKRLAEGLVQLPQLRKLELASNSFGMEGAEALAVALPQLGQLRELYLHDNGLEEDAILILFRSVSNVKKLQVFDFAEDTAISGDGYNAIAQSLSHLHHLHNISLLFSDMGAHVGILCETFTQMKYLSDLDLGHTDLGAEGGRVLAQYLPRLTGLQSLRIEYNELGDDAIIAISRSVVHLAQLKGLYLADNMIGPAGMKKLSASLRHLTELQTLDLSYNEIDFEGGRALSGALPYLMKLENLNLEYNEEIGADAINIIISSLPHLRRLKSLNLNHTNINLEGARHLSGVLVHLKQLTDLFMGGNNMTEEGVRLIISSLLPILKNMKHLDISRNGCSQDKINTLRWLVGNDQVIIG